MSRKLIDKELLLEAARKLDSYAWSDFASLVESLPAITPEQLLNDDSAASAEQLMAVQFCRCDNPDACPLAAYERKERRYWQLIAQQAAALPEPQDRDEDAWNE